MQRTLLAASALTALLIGPAGAQTNQQGTQPPGQPLQTQPAVPRDAAGQQGTAAQQQPTQPAQQPPAGQQPEPQMAAQPQPAEQCLSDLRALADRMNEEGYWLTGWREGVAAPGMTAPEAGPVGGPAPGMGAVPTEPVPPNQVATTPPPAPEPGTVADVQAPVAGPWGETGWALPPRYEIRSLYAAAYVLGNRGQQEACQTVLTELEQVYGQYVAQLQEAGVEPGQVIGWREQEILTARPVTELGSAIRLEDVRGTDLRNAQDENLGSVEDVVFDPASGQIAYAIVARGGFLGIGRDYVAVPWQQLRATAGLNTFVLNVPQEVMENAPTVDPNALSNPQVLEQQRQQIDQYWQQHQAG